MNGRVAGDIAFAAIFALSLVTGFIGLDFGFHWDEPVQYGLVTASLKSGILLPAGFYNYPSMTYVLSTAAQLPAVVGQLWLDTPRSPVEDWLTLERFLLNARSVALVLSCLGGLWLYLALRRTHPGGAVVAGAVYLTSWEFAYHARWLAPDAVMAQFAGLWLLALMQAERSRHTTAWRRAAVVAAGLAAATKYQGGALLFATLATLLLENRDGWAPRSKLREAAVLGAIFGVTFLVITPGALLQPLEFIRDIRFEARHYATGHSVAFGTRPYDVPEGFFTYFARLAEYVGLAMFSRNAIVSCLIFALAVFGFVALWRESRRSAAVVSGLVLFYAAFFSTQVVFIARNLLLLLPIFAFASGIGAQLLTSASRPGWLRAGAAAAIAVAIGWNAVDLWRTASSIRALSSPDALLARTHDYVAARPETPFHIARPLRTALLEAGYVLPANAAQSDADAAVFLFRHSDLQGTNPVLREWPGTRAQTFDWIGPREVNFNYYPTWRGRDRVLILPLAQARSMGVLDHFGGRAPQAKRRDPPVGQRWESATSAQL